MSFRVILNVLITDGSFNPRRYGCQYRRQICGHVYQDKDSEAVQAHQGNLSPVDLDQDILINLCCSLNPPSVFHMDVNKNDKIYMNTF